MPSPLADPWPLHFHRRDTMTNDSTLAAAPRRRGLLQLLTGSAVLLGGALLWQGSNLQAAEQAVRIPPPAQDATATGQGPQKAIFAGGCFWEIGRAACRERVEISVVAGSFKKKNRGRT